LDIVFILNILYNIIKKEVAMMREDVFSPSRVFADNIAKLTDRQSVLEEQRICEISNLAYDAATYSKQMLDSGYSIYELFSVLSEGMDYGAVNPHKRVLAENVSRILTFLETVTAHDKTVFTELFLSKLSDFGIFVTELDFLPTLKGGETFIYVKNPLSDEAYDVFSQEFNDPRVKYASSFSDAVRAISSGEAEYGLLPLEERGGARLAAVAALIFREDLKINSVIPVFGYEGTADMKYAMVSKHFTVSGFNPDDDRYLEIRLRVDSSISLSELLSSAEALGAGIYRVNTISFETEDGMVSYYSVVFRDEGKDFSSLLTYLTLFSGAYTCVGLYKNIE
jgi:hypothetical protein